MFITDPQFGEIVNFDHLRETMRQVYDELSPDFCMLGGIEKGSELYHDEPNYMIAGGASMLAYMMLLAADEHELAEELKDYLFTLGWTEEAVGTDLLSIRTQATPLSDDPNEREYHLTGQKWLINNSYHADYHMILAKVDPDQDGPRSMSLFLVPRSSCKNWQRLETHVLQHMVLTTFDIDGPGRLVGKRGHGLSIVQRMAMPSKYQCSYVGVQMLRQAIPATIDHLASKRIFGDNPVKFSNVFRQLYGLALKSAALQYMYYRAIVFSDTDFLQFHGTMLKSFLLLRVNEVLGHNLLVAGSKGFLKESPIGRNAIDSFVLPVFDGHYTLNTLLTAKQAKDYINADRAPQWESRQAEIRAHVGRSLVGEQIFKQPKDIRRPKFFDYVAYLDALALPIDLDAQRIIDTFRSILREVDERGLQQEAEYKYKIGMMVHWCEAVLATAEMVRVFDDERYLNAVIQMVNGLVNQFNEIIAEGALETPFMTPLHWLPMPEVAPEDRAAFLHDLQDMDAQFTRVNAQAAADAMPSPAGD